MKGQGDMAGQTQRASWRCIEVAAEMLTPLEREVVLGDLAETNRGVWCGLADVSGFAARRQLALWRSWRPWAASVGLALPASLFLMGCSVAASAAFASLLGEPAQARLLWLSLSRLFLVISWAWMRGLLWARSRGVRCGPACWRVVRP